MTVNLAFTDADAALAQRIAADLSDINEKGSRPALVAVISPEAVSDPDVLRQISDAGPTVIPVLAGDTPLPDSIAHLKPLDFRRGAYPIARLKAQVSDMVIGGPNLRQRNRRAGLIIAVLALIIFGVGIYGVGVLGIRAPQDEFDSVETQRVQQRNTLIAPTLEPLIPVGQFAISQFELTVTAAPTRLREFLVGTVTATAQGTYIPTSTPRPTESEG